MEKYNLNGKIHSVEREPWEQEICIPFIQFKILTERILGARLRVTIRSKEEKFSALMELEISVKSQPCSM